MDMFKAALFLSLNVHWWYSLSQNNDSPQSLDRGCPSPLWKLCSTNALKRSEAPPKHCTLHRLWWETFFFKLQRFWFLSCSEQPAAVWRGGHLDVRGLRHLLRHRHTQHQDVRECVQAHGQTGMSDYVRELTYFGLAKNPQIDKSKNSSKLLKQIFSSRVVTREKCN